MRAILHDVVLHTRPAYRSGAIAHVTVELPDLGLSLRGIGVRMTDDGLRVTIPTVPMYDTDGALVRHEWGRVKCEGAVQWADRERFQAFGEAVTGEFHRLHPDWIPS